MLKIKILYLTNIPSPYKIAFFNEIGKFCELTVLFEQELSSERETSWHDYNFENFKGVFLKKINFTFKKVLSLQVIRYLSNINFDHIILGGYSTPTSVLAITYLNLMKKPFIMSIDGGLIKTNESNIIFRIKRWFISSAKAWLSTGRMSNLYLEYYGANKSNIYIYPFTTLSESDINEEILNHEKKEILKNELNISDKRIILAVGRFIYSKGFDTLLKASSKLSDSTYVYLVGGVPTDYYKEIIESEDLNNIKFFNFMSKNELKKLYNIADIFVLPTRSDVWGLVVNEAMASGLPVITTEKCVAGIELVENYENGFIVPADDEKILSDKINEIILNQDLLEEMSYKSLRKIKPYTIKNMAIQTMKILIKLEEDSENAKNTK